MTLQFKTARMTLPVASICFTLLHASVGSSNAVKTLPNFKAELAYVVPREQGSWVSITFDESGRIIASDQHGHLYRLTLALNGQPANRTKVEKIDVAIGRGHGLLYAFNSLYVLVSEKA